jgi:hypothetical protein
MATINTMLDVAFSRVTEIIAMCHTKTKAVKAPPTPNAIVLGLLADSHNQQNTTVLKFNMLANTAILDTMAELNFSDIVSDFDHMQEVNTSVVFSLLSRGGLYASTPTHVTAIGHSSCDIIGRVLLVWFPITVPGDDCPGHKIAGSRFAMHLHVGEVVCNICLSGR